MFPAARSEFANTLLRARDKYLPRPGDSADLGDRYSGDVTGNALARRNGEEQFVIFSAMEGQVEIDFTHWSSHVSPGNERCVEHGSYATLFANVRQIGRQAITRIDHGGRQVFLAERARKFDPRGRIEVPDDSIAVAALSLDGQAFSEGWRPIRRARR